MVLGFDLYLDGVITVVDAKYSLDQFSCLSCSDEELGSDLYLDGVITVVDAKYSLDQLQEPTEDR